MRIAVTGGTGYLGSNLCRRLKDAGHEIRIVSRSLGYDITQAGRLEGAFRSCDAVFHLAATVQSRPGKIFQEVNVRALEGVFEECKNSRVKRVIYISSFTVFGPSGQRPHSEESVPTRSYFFHDYDRTKYEGWRVAREWQKKIPLDIVYPAVVYGPGPLTEGNILTHLLRRWHGTHFAALPAMGEPVWNFIYIDDLVDGLLRHLLKGAGQDFVLGGENRSLRELAEVFRSVSDRRIVIIPMPSPLFYLSSYVEDLQSRMRGTPPLVLPSTSRFFVCDWKLSSRKAESLLKFSPRPLEEGMEATWEWMSRDLIT